MPTPIQTVGLPSGIVLQGDDAMVVIDQMEQVKALRKELERVKGERDALLIACKRALNYANNVGEAEGVLFDNDGDIPAIAAAIAAQGEQ